MALGHGEMQRVCVGGLNGLNDAICFPESISAFETIVGFACRLSKLITAVMSKAEATTASATRLCELLTIARKDFLPSDGALPNSVKIAVEKLLERLSACASQVATLFKDESRTIFNACLGLEMKSCGTADLVRKSLRDWATLLQEGSADRAPGIVDDLLLAAAQASDLNDRMNNCKADESELAAAQPAIQTLKEAIIAKPSKEGPSALNAFCAFMGLDLVDTCEKLQRAARILAGKIDDCQKRHRSEGQRLLENCSSFEEAAEIERLVPLPESEKDESSFQTCMKGTSETFPQGANRIFAARAKLEKDSSLFKEPALQERAQLMMKALRERLFIYALVANMRGRAFSKKRKRSHDEGDDDDVNDDHNDDADGDDDDVDGGDDDDDDDGGDAGDDADDDDVDDADVADEDGGDDDSHEESLTSGWCG